MKKSKVVIPALGLIALSTAASITGTVAWFSANNVVTISGMQVSTKVGDNLLVSATNENAASYSTSLNQTRTGILEPVSTIDGVNFQYHATTNLDGSGKPTDAVYVAYNEDTSNPDTPAGKTAYDNEFQVNYGINAPTTVAYGFIDYSYYVKAINAGANTKKLNITELNLTYNGAMITEKAWRVAVFAQNANEYAPNNTAVAAGDRTAMLIRSGAVNYTSGQAVNNSGVLADVTYTSAVWSVADVLSGATKYTKVTVRLWLEGEDKTCNNETFAALTQNWKLDLEMKLEDTSANAVVNIQSIAARIQKAANVGTAVLDGEATASTYQWYNSDDSVITGATTSTYTNETNAAKSVYVIIKTAAGKAYRSPVVELDAQA